MFVHYLKMGFRSLMKYKKQTLISVFGLAIGFVCFALSVLWLRYEMTFDHFHRDSDRIYLVKQKNPEIGWGEGYPFASYLKEKYPEVEQAVPFVKTVYQQADGKETSILRVSPEFFRMFGVDFISGNEQQFFTDLGNIIITDKEAALLYPDSSPIGRRYSINGQRTKTYPSSFSMYDNTPNELTVSSVVKGWSEHSDLYFDYLIPLEDKGWSYPYTHVFVKLRDGTDAEAFADKLNSDEFLTAQIAIQESNLFLFPLQSLHFSNASFGKPGNLKFGQVIMFAVAGFVTILCLLFNYLSLFISRMQQQGRGLALRLALGSGYAKLYKQLCVEFMMVLVLAFLIGFALIEWLMPDFVQFAHIKIGLWEIYGELFVYIALILLLSWILSLVPLIKIRSTSVISVFSGTGSSPNKAVFQNFLLSFQLTIGLLFIFCTAVFVKQLYYMSSVDPGFDRTRLCFVYAKDGKPFGPEYDFSHEAQAVAAYPEIEQACTYSWGAISVFDEYRLGMGQVGKTEESGSSENIDCFVQKVPIQYFDVCGIKCLQGRLFNEDDIEWNNDKVIVNQAVAKLMGVDNPIGQKLNDMEKDREIIGVVNDVYESATQESNPYVYYYTNSAKGLVYRYKEGKGNRADVERKVTKLLQDRMNGQELQFTYMEEAMEKQNRSELNFLMILYIFSFVCITGSLFGIYSMVSLACERRRKEIAVRKVHGAGLDVLIRLFLKKYLLLLVGTSIVSFLVGYILMHQWLQQFIKQTDVNWWLYPVIFTTLAAILAVIIITRIWRTLHINPALELKRE